MSGMGESIREFGGIREPEWLVDRGPLKAGLRTCVAPSCRPVLLLRAILPTPPEPRADSFMDPVTTFIILMLAVAVLSLLATRFGVPYPTMMVIGGLVISCIPSVFGARSFHPPEIAPNLIFTLF